MLLRFSSLDHRRFGLAPAVLGAGALVAVACSHDLTILDGSGGSEAVTSSVGQGGSGGSTSGSTSSTTGSGGLGGEGGGAPECTDPADCPLPLETCRVRTCEGGVCGFANSDPAAPCGVAGVCNEDGQCVGCNEPDDCGEPTDCAAPTCEDDICGLDYTSGGETCSEGVCDGSGSCVECTLTSHCPTPPACVQATCNGNVCGTTNITSGTACATGYCNGSGSCVECTQVTHCPMGTQCAPRSCTGNTCGFTNASSGTACTGGYCNGSGSCVECTLASHCTSTGGGECVNNVCTWHRYSRTYTVSNNTWTKTPLSTLWTATNSPPRRGIIAAEESYAYNHLHVWADNGLYYRFNGSTWNTPAAIGTRFPGISATTMRAAVMWQGDPGGTETIVVYTGGTTPRQAYFYGITSGGTVTADAGNPFPMAQGDGPHAAPQHNTDASWVFPVQIAHIGTPDWVRYWVGMVNGSNYHLQWRVQHLGFQRGLPEPAAGLGRDDQSADAKHRSCRVQEGKHHVHDRAVRRGLRSL